LADYASKFNCVGRGTIECINTRSLSIEAKNRWTASNGTILGIAERNTGVVTAGGAGVLRFFDGIQNCIREIDLDRIITRVEVERLSRTTFPNTADRLFVSCGPDGITSFEFGGDFESLEGEVIDADTVTTSPLLAASYSDRYFLRNWMT